MEDGKEIHIKSKSILNLPVQQKRCQDYDDDCQFFTTEKAWNCWIGSCAFIEKIGQWVYADQADGYCPVVHSQYNF